MKDIKLALVELEKELKESDHFIYPYFVRHRNRFINDGHIIKQYYKQGTILDIGCFPCHFTILLKKLNFPVIGIDLKMDRCIPFAKRFDLSLKQCDIERESLPYADKSISFVIFNEVFEHLHKDPLFALSEINRVMTKNGVLLFTTPNLYATHKIFRFLIGSSFNDAWFEFSKLRGTGHMGHFREYAPSEIRKFLVMHCFRIRKVKYSHYGYYNSLRGVAGWLIYRLSPPRFRTYQVIVAEKASDCPILVPFP